MLFPDRNARTGAEKKINDPRGEFGTALCDDLHCVREVRNDLAHEAGDAPVVTDDHANFSFEVADRLIAMEWGLDLGLGGRGLTL